MQELTQQEQIVLNSIVFLGRCRITHIRTFIKRTTPDLFTTKDITIDMREKLSKLHSLGWITISEGGYYDYTEKINYAWLKNAVKSFDFCTQLAGRSELKKDFSNDYYQRDMTEHISIICAVAYYLLGNVKEAQAMDDFFNSPHRYYYDSYQSGQGPVHRQAIRYLLRFPDFQNDMQQLPKSFILEILPDCILSAMLDGSAIPEWRSLCKDIPATQFEQTLPAFLCAAFLENDRQGLINLIGKASDAFNVEIGQALCAMLSGEWKKADQKFTHYLNSTYLPKHYQDPQIIMLVVLATIPLCMISGASSRFLKWMDFLNKIFDREALSQIARHYALFYKCLAGRAISSHETGYSLALPIYRIIGLPVFCMNPKFELPPKTAEESIQTAKTMLANKQITMGVYLLNAAGTLLDEDDPQRREIEEITKQYNVVPFFKMTKRNTEWENSLLALEKMIPVAAPESTTPKREEHISWMLKTAKAATGKGMEYTSLEKIKPFFLHTNKSGKSSMKEISYNKLKKGEFDPFLSPQELGVKAFVGDLYYYDPGIKPEAVKFLENSTSVFLNDLDHRVKLVPEKNTILSKVKKDGSVELRLKYFPDYDYTYPENTIFLDTAEEGICRYCKITEQDKLLSTFSVCCDDSKCIKIPKEGLKRLADLAARMSAVVPFSGPLSAEAYRDLPQLDGMIDFHVQVSREQDEFLFEIRNKPCPESTWFIKPGHEPEQKILDLHDKKVLLKRNLPVEKKLIREMLEKCPSLPGMAKSDFSFDLDDPEQILNCLAELKEAGFTLDWNSGSPLKISRKLDYSNIRLSSGDGMDWFSIGGDLQVSPDNVIQLTALLNALDRRTGNFIELDDHSYLQLTRDLVKKLEILKAAGNITSNQLKISPAALPMLSTAFESGLPEKLQEHVEQIREAFRNKINLPLNLHGSLRPYQEEGFRYLARLADCRIGCCIADDMGLGKTIQLLTLLLRESKQGPALVVVPASLCRNWEREAQKFAPSLHTVNMPVLDREKVIKSAGKGDLLICSYGILSSEEKLFAGKKWHIVILDEAQAIKNDTAKRTKAAKTLQADIRIVSTGTPIENRLMELWSIFDFLNPGLLGSSKSFDAKFCMNGMPRPELKKLVSPLIIRRKKEDVLDDLPPKTEITLPFELPEEERNMYEILRQKAIAELQNQELSHITILAHLTKLRRFCCDPSLIWKDHGTGTKLQKLLELAEDLKAAGHRALIFSQYVDFLAIIRKAFDEKGFSYQYLDGSCSQANRMQSVDDFQNGIGDFFLISLKAGGTGLNLTAANYVILTDPWWNPAVEDQAADRVHRIGQHEPVTVYRLIAEKTVEERVLELHAKKKKVSEDILTNAENTALSVTELMSLFNA